MHIDQTRTNIGYKARLNDIGKRLGVASKAHLNCKETIEWLLNRDAIEFLSN